MSEITTIIFDIGNVLANFGWEPYFRSFGFSQEVLDKLQKATVSSAAWCEYDRGVMTDDEIERAFVKNDPSIKKEIHFVTRSFSGMVTKMPETIPWLHDLKQKGYHLYYLSNFSRKAHVECREALDFLPLMDGGILSYQDKVIKPDTAIYELLLNRYRLKAEHCVFIDDTPKNLKTAEKLGIKTVLFQNRKQVLHDLELLGIGI